MSKNLRQNETWQQYQSYWPMQCTVTFSRSFTSFTSHFHVPSGWTSSSFRYWHGLTWVQPEVPVIECWVRWPEAHWSVQSGAMRKTAHEDLESIWKQCAYRKKWKRMRKQSCQELPRSRSRKKTRNQKNIWKSSGCSGFRLAIGINLLSVKTMLLETEQEQVHDFEDNGFQHSKQLYL